MNQILPVLKTNLLPRIFGGFFGLAIRLFASFLFIWSLQSCQEPDEIGLGLIDSQASFSTTDTLTVQVFSQETRKVPTNFSANNLLGVMNDPVFGKIKSGIFTEFRLPQNNFSLGDDVALDSIVLSLGYSGRSYGQVETFQRIRVYELTASMPDRDTLYSDTFVPFDPNPVGERLLRPAPADSVAIDTLMYPAHFTIRLSDAFGQKIIDANGTDAFRDIPSFLEYFKGFYIAPDEDIDGTGAIFNINMFSGFTRLTLFYRLNGETPTRFDFFISDFTRRSSYFQTLNTEGAHPLLVEQLSGQQPALAGDSLLFVQGMARVRGNIRFPHLYELRRLEGLVINQARLVFTAAAEFSSENFRTAGRLILYKFDKDGQMTFLSDHMMGDEYFGGAFIADKNHYRFNITSHIQRLLDGKEEDYGLALVVAGSADGAERVVLRGPGAATDAVRLEILYTTFD